MRRDSQESEKAVWVAANGQGLAKLSRNKLKPVDEDVLAEHLDARGERVLVCGPDVIGELVGEKVQPSVHVTVFNKLLEDRPPLWKR